MNNEERPAGAEAENELKPMAPTSSQTIANTHVVGSQCPAAHEDVRKEEGDTTTIVGKVIAKKYPYETITEGFEEARQIYFRSRQGKEKD